MSREDKARHVLLLVFPELQKRNGMDGCYESSTYVMVTMKDLSQNISTILKPATVGSKMR